MKKYELSLSRDYVSNWGVIEAIRELLQNAYDEGNEEIVIENNSITISNLNTTIPSSNLLLGNSSKRNDSNTIGQFGEGFKLAILVLLRNNCSVNIKNGQYNWKPSFEYSNNFGCETLMIEETNNSTNKDLIFNISNISTADFKDIQENFLNLSNDEYKKIDTQYGEILLDSEYSGRMFVNKLPIMYDNNFELGFNFKPEYVTLDRDRKSINLRELYTICANSIMSMEKPDFDMVDKLLAKGSEDIRKVKDRDISMPNEFVESYSKHLIEKYDIKENSVVVSENSKLIIEELERKQKKGEDLEIVPLKLAVLADIINRTHTNSSNTLRDVDITMKERNKYDDAWEYYEDSEYKVIADWYISNHKYDEIAFENFINAMICIEPYNFRLIKDKVIPQIKLEMEK